MNTTFESMIAVAFLGIGMLLLIGGFFALIGGSAILSKIIIGAGAVFEFLGFFLGYMGYKKSVAASKKQ